MPVMNSAVQLLKARKRTSELYSSAIKVGTPIQIVVTHPLQEILHMAFVRL